MSCRWSRVVCIVVARLALCTLALQPDESIKCSVIVAGGSMASLAAAITAAEAAPELSVCFTEPTDWPGGQLTAGGDPAVDFGPGHYDARPENMPRSLRQMLGSIPGNPGACTISTMCYNPAWLVDSWIMPRLSRSPNLQVFVRTAIVGVQRSGGSVVSLTGVQRSPKNPSHEWSVPLSRDLEDWYSPDESERFTKRVLSLIGPDDAVRPVLIDATELGDVLGILGMSSQGVEVPSELSDTSNWRCGQAATTSFYMQLAPASRPPPLPPQPPLLDWDWGSNKIQNASEWVSSWVWRRAQCADPVNATACPPDAFWNPSEAQVVNVGDVSQQDKGNALTTGYFLLDRTAVSNQIAQGGWKGGVNLTVLHMLESRSRSWFEYVTKTSRYQSPYLRNRLALSTHTSGTLHGLSKWPYLRDSRRCSRGIESFRLAFNGTMNYQNESAPLLGYRFHDAVGLANAFVHSYPLMTDPECPTATAYPAYLWADNQTKPFWIPLRALTVQNFTNLLVAGKTMAQTAHANDATRKHTGEWTSGVAAGGVAVLMARNQWSSTDAYHNVAAVQGFLNSTHVGQPLDWDI